MEMDMFQMKAREYGITPLPHDPQVAMAYVPYQTDPTLYNAEQGLECGTMFPVLNKPFIGCKGMRI